MKLQMHRDWCLLTDDENKPITNKTWWEAYALAKEWSVKTGKNLEMIPVKTAEKLCGTDKEFKTLLTKYWIWNTEILKTCKDDKELKRKLNLKTKHICQWSNDDGISSVRSGWDTDEGCFGAVAGGPSGRLGLGVVVFSLNTRSVRCIGHRKSNVVVK